MQKDELAYLLKDHVQNGDDIPQCNFLQKIRTNDYESFSKRKI